jgi:hypothetical protein
MTLSLFNSPSFLTKSTEPVSVTSMWSHNIYICFSTRLILSYVIALVLALVSSVCGLLAIRHNGASYSNKVSTFLRVAVQQDLYSLIPPDDQRGAGPLPRSVANAKFDLKRVPTDSSLLRVESRGTFQQDDTAKGGGVVVEQSSV